MKLIKTLAFSSLVAFSTLAFTACGGEKTTDAVETVEVGAEDLLDEAGDAADNMMEATTEAVDSAATGAESAMDSTAAAVEEVVDEATK